MTSDDQPDAQPDDQPDFTDLLSDLLGPPESSTSTGQADPLTEAQLLALLVDPEDELPWWARRTVGLGIAAMTAVFFAFTGLEVVAAMPTTSPVTTPVATPVATYAAPDAVPGPVQGDLVLSSGSAASEAEVPPSIAAPPPPTAADVAADADEAAASAARADRRRQERKLLQVRREIAQARAAQRELQQASVAVPPPLLAPPAPVAFDPMAMTAGVPSTQPWLAPLASYRITARFGQSGRYWASTHTGLDLAAPTGTPVMAVTGGTVTFAGENGAYGQRVALTHPDGTETWYAHLSRIDVAVGAVVAPGGVLGAVGSTGNSSGPHLHLEVRPMGGDPVDPATALAEHGVTL